jgi:hypothetical protein
LIKDTLPLFAREPADTVSSPDDVDLRLREFTSEVGGSTRVETRTVSGRDRKYYVNEFWTARQRQACSIHEISYRACFKPQLPRFFIELFTVPGEIVYDPFSGRGTTSVEAALLGRRVVANDINPLAKVMAEPRLMPPDKGEPEKRLSRIPIISRCRADLDLSMFYHPDTESEIMSLRRYLNQKRSAGREDDLDRWIRMVATNRLTGHSKGFFSVYTLPPNQATSPERQRLINQRRNQTPEYRDTRALILKKSKQLLKKTTAVDIRNLYGASRDARFLTCSADDTKAIGDGEVCLTVTSPPFLNVVQYSQDNWLRCWFNGLDSRKIAEGISVPNSPAKWTRIMAGVFQELYRVTGPGKWVAFEVGEVNKQAVRLEEYVIPIGEDAGFTVVGVLINQQNFTKTSNIWGVDNNIRGTNTNRIVMLQK